MQMNMSTTDFFNQREPDPIAPTELPNRNLLQAYTILFENRARLIKLSAEFGKRYVHLGLGIN